jgi:hypothetical protein
MNMHHTAHMHLFTELGLALVQVHAISSLPPAEAKGGMMWLSLLTSYRCDMSILRQC